MRYDEYMNGDLWPLKRQARLEIDKFECRLCGSKDRLEVHHKPGSYCKIPNESVEDDLTTLCLGCHDVITSRIRKMRYDRRPVEVVAHVSPERKVAHHEPEDCSIPSYRDHASDRSQWTIGRPAQLLRESDEGSDQQAKEGRG